MKTLTAFMKKEILEHLRSGRLVILGLLFLLLGVMNPAVAKLTPWLFEVMADDLAQSGMSVTVVTVTAMDSWVQFFKNIPIGLIAFVLLESGIFTKEYQSGTLVLSLTKGLPRWQVVAAKAAMLLLLWTIGYWAVFGVTYGYTAWYWDNSIAQNLLFSATCWWLFGLWVNALLTLFSVIARSNIVSMAGTGGAVLAACLLGMLPKLSEYSPAALTGGNALIYGAAEPASFVTAIIITALTGILFLAAAFPLFNKKHL